MEKLKVFNPYDESFIEELERTSEADAFAALETAYRLHADRSRWLPVYRRIEILEKALDIMKEEPLSLARAAAREGGKPLMDSTVEIDRAINGIKLAIEELSHFKGTEIPMNLSPSSANRMAYTMREPRGVVVAISAFNHPFNLIVHQVIPALAVGCPVLVKPASATPLSCRNLMNILYRAGLPEDWCQMILCDNTVAEGLIADPRVAFMSFIGSSKVGWHLRSKLGPGAACTLEHGGVAPVIFDETADIDKAIPLLSKGGFYHAGQVCVSVQKVFVHDHLADELSRKLADAARSLIVGDPLDERTEVGPLITPAEVDRVSEWVSEARERGGSILCGGRRQSKTCYEPTVILNPDDGARVSRKEVFGPVVSVYSYSRRNQAIERANQLNYSFQAAVFTRDLDVALDTVKRLNAAAVMVNDHTAFRVDWMPFGGHKDSGLGVGGIGPSMREMTAEKLMVIKSDVL